MYALRRPAALTLALLLAACGGGGGGDSSPAPTPPPPPPPPAPIACSISIVADGTVEAGQTAGATAIPANCGSTQIASVVWSQVSGPAVALPAARQPTISFESAAAGVVRLRADVTFAGAGGTATASSDVTVTAPSAGSQVTVRVDHSVRPGTDTSVRAWPTLVAGETLTSITWTQLAGPTVTLDTSIPRVMVFKAPAVAAEPLRFRATMVTSSGRTDTDDVYVSVDSQTATPNDYIFERTARVHPYVAAGAYASVLARCAYDVSLFYTTSANQNLCPVGTLPLLQANTDASGIPTVAQVMSRVLVSHDFLGANFEAFLQTQDPFGDFRRMLAGTTAIVIGSHVRPSFYTAGTGAIYLDANFLWLNADQRDVVTEVPDYRIAFADGLNFTGLGRLVKDNQYARFGYSTTQRVTRTQADLVLGLGRLLYHELAHASDFFPPAERNLDSQLGIFLNVSQRLSAKTLPSDALSIQFPLTSMEMKGIGQVLYQGTTATAEQKAYTPAQIGAFFGSDVASDDYSYSSTREDLAMLFEEFMLKYRHNVQYDVGYSNLFTDGMTSQQLLVAWGQRGRIGSPAIKPRVKLVLSRITPWIPASAVDALPAPIQMTPGRSWDDNLVISPGSPKIMQSSIMTQGRSADQARDDVMFRRHAH